MCLIRQRIDGRSSTQCVFSSNTGRGTTLVFLNMFYDNPPNTWFAIFNRAQIKGNIFLISRGFIQQSQEKKLKNLFFLSKKNDTFFSMLPRQ